MQRGSAPAAELLARADAWLERIAARLAERWHARLSRLLAHELRDAGQSSPAAPPPAA